MSRGSALVIRAAISALVTLISACGGGGDSGDTGASATPPAAVVTPAPPAVTQTAPATGATPTSPASSGVTAATSCNLLNFQADVLGQINAARASSRLCGSVSFPAAAALTWNNTLFTAAARHSQNMATRQFFDHINPDGVTASQRVTLAGYVWSATGENIAAGYPDVSAVMKAWLDSPGHCKNIMNSAYVDVAVSCASTTRVQYPTYWTMELARPR